MANRDYTRDILDKIWGIKYAESSTLNEATEYNEKAVDTKSETKSIAITDDPIFGDKVLSSEEEQFKSAVDSGAEFTKPSNDDVASSPLIYMPETKNLVFSGTIPALNNLRFQMVLRTSSGDGLFLWTDGMILNENNIRTLNKLYGFFKNWKTSWGMKGGDLERLNNLLDNR